VDKSSDKSSRKRKASGLLDVPPERSSKKVRSGVLAWLSKVDANRFKGGSPSPSRASAASSRNSSVKAASTPTVSRLTKDDKDDLTKENRALFVALPKSVKQQRGTILAAAKAHCIQHADKGLQAVIPSADSFFAVVFDTTSSRDKGLKSLKKVAALEHNGKKVQLVIHPFGQKTGGKGLVWTVPVGPLDTPNDLVLGLRELLVEEPVLTNGLEIRQVLFDKVYTGTLSVRFPSPPPWKGKHVTVKGRTRLITVEAPDKCRLCNSLEHSSWDCDDNTRHALGTKVWRIQGGAAVEGADESSSESDESGEDERMKE